MDTILDKSTSDVLIQRVRNLTEFSEARWGKMNVVQMLEHCNDSSKMAIGTKKMKRMFLGRIFGKMILKKALKNDIPLKKNSPTVPELISIGENEFKTEKEDFIRVLSTLGMMKIEDFNGRIHPFFGEMTGKEWGVLMYKHFNHHLVQFGV